MQTDKESPEVTKAFNELNGKWKDACNKKWTRLIPDRDLFSKQVEIMLKEENKVNGI
jgi:hypothetical protein